MNDVIQNLPWQIQVSLASGYAAYLIAYIGIRFAHTSVDTLFISLAFGLFTTGAMWVMRAIDPIYSVPAAFLFTIAIAILWRAFARGWFYSALYALNITWSNDDPSALATISANSKHRISQIGVQLDDGTWLTCRHADRFRDAPFRPMTIGPSGDIALYLTHEEPPGQPETELTTVRDDKWGDRLTYIPAARIKRITIRHER